MYINAMTSLTFFSSLGTTFSYIWFGLLLAFIGVELLALHYNRKHQTSNNEGGTLSELIRRMIKGNRIVFAIFTIFYIYLAYHFVFEG